MPLIQHSPEFLAKQARRKKLDEILAEQEKAALKKELEKANPNPISDNRVSELISEVSRGRNYQKALTSEELSMLFEMTRFFKLNHTVCKKMFGKTSDELYVEFESIQEALQYNLKINKYIDAFGYKAKLKLREIESHLMKYLRKHRVLDEEPKEQKKMKKVDAYQPYQPNSPLK